MRSYSIAVLCHSAGNDDKLLECLAQFRQQLPFASIYWYGSSLEDSKRIALQKQDVTIRNEDTHDAFKITRRMFTEVDADVFVYVGDTNYPAELASSMIHQLVETRKDMVAIINPNMHCKLQNDYRKLCAGLYGRELQAPLSDYRVFSRRFIKSFAGFERSLPVELEWSIHALELDIPYMELPIAPATVEKLPRRNIPCLSGGRHLLTRIILNLQSRPLKWFGLITMIFLVMTMIFKVSFYGDLFEVFHLIPRAIAAIGAGSFGVLSFISALFGILLHSKSHHQRELKRLHFQQHSTL